MVAFFSSFNATQGKRNIAMAVAAVVIRAAAIDIGLEATGCIFRSQNVEAIVFCVAAATLENVQARIAFEATL
jgi:hypothetical protein